MASQLVRFHLLGYRAVIFHLSISTYYFPHTQLFPHTCTYFHTYLHTSTHIYIFPHTSTHFCSFHLKIPNKQTVKHRLEIQLPHGAIMTDFVYMDKIISSLSLFHNFISLLSRLIPSLHFCFSFPFLLILLHI